MRKTCFLLGFFLIFNSKITFAGILELNSIDAIQLENGIFTGLNVFRPCSALNLEQEKRICEGIKVGKTPSISTPSRYCSFYEKSSLEKHFCKGISLFNSLELDANNIEIEKQCKLSQICRYLYFTKKKIENPNTQAENSNEFLNLTEVNEDILNVFEVAYRRYRNSFFDHNMDGVYPPIDDLIDEMLVLKSKLNSNNVTDFSKMSFSQIAKNFGFSHLTHSTSGRNCKEIIKSGGIYSSYEVNKKNNNIFSGAVGSNHFVYAMISQNVKERDIILPEIDVQEYIPEMGDDCLFIIGIEQLEGLINNHYVHASLTWIHGSFNIDSEKFTNDDFGKNNFARFLKELAKSPNSLENNEFIFHRNISLEYIDKIILSRGFGKGEKFKFINPFLVQ